MSEPIWISSEESSCKSSNCNSRFPWVLTGNTVQVYVIITLKAVKTTADNWWKAWNWNLRSCLTQELVRWIQPKLWKYLQKWQVWLKLLSLYYSAWFWFYYSNFWGCIVCCLVCSCVFINISFSLTVDNRVFPIVSSIEFSVFLDLSVHKHS